MATLILGSAARLQMNSNRISYKCYIYHNEGAYLTVSEQYLAALSRSSIDPPFGFYSAVVSEFVDGYSS
jgi:hypothetical protein